MRRYVWNSVIIWYRVAWLNRAIIKLRVKVCVIQWPLSIILIEAERAHKICRDESKRLKPDEDIYRERFLVCKLKEKVASGNTKNTKEIKSLMDKEISMKTEQHWKGSIKAKRRECEWGRHMSQWHIS